MGYRSDVYLRVSDESAKVLDIARKMDKKLDEIISEGITGIFPYTGMCHTEMHWSNTKWYEGYEGVDAVDNILSQLPEDNYGFIRLGENDDDVETKGDPTGYDMYVSRRIEW